MDIFIGNVRVDVPLTTFHCVKYSPSRSVPKFGVRRAFDWTGGEGIGEMQCPNCGIGKG